MTVKVTGGQTSKNRCCKPDRLTDGDKRSIFFLLQIRFWFLFPKTEKVQSLSELPNDLWT